MVLFCFLWFTALYFITFKLSKNNDLLSPVKFVSLKYALLNLPFLLFTAFNPKSFTKSILLACNTNLNDAFLQYTIVQTVAYISLVLGIYIYSRWKRTLVTEEADVKAYNYKYVKGAALFFLGIGLVAYLVFLYRIGGLNYLLSHLDKRVELQSGQYVLYLLNFLNFSVLLFLLCVKLKNNLWNKLLFFCVLIGCCLVFSSFGARKNTLILLILIVVSYHYTIRRIKISAINKPVILGATVLLVAYILIIPVFRLKKGFINLHENKAAYGNMFNVKALVYNVSYTFIDVFAANYYNEENAWHLKGITDPVTVALTKGDKSVAPPVDQGVYFWNVVKNKKDFRPPIPRGEMDKNSWPIENFGFGYANFLLPGVVIAFLLQGLVFAFCYNLLQKDVYNPVLIYTYVFAIFNFNFSNLRMVQLITVLPLALFCYWVLQYFKKYGGHSS